MILVDTSVWVDPLGAHEWILTRLREGGRMLVHPFVIGGLALSRLRQCDFILSALRDLPTVHAVTDEEVPGFIDRYALSGSGIGDVDVHLLAATQLTADAV